MPPLARSRDSGCRPTIAFMPQFPVPFPEAYFLVFAETKQETAQRAALPTSHSLRGRRAEQLLHFIRMVAPSGEPGRPVFVPLRAIEGFSPAGAVLHTWLNLWGVGNRR